MPFLVVLQENFLFRLGGSSATVTLTGANLGRSPFPHQYLCELSSLQDLELSRLMPSSPMRVG